MEGGALVRLLPRFDLGGAPLVVVHTKRIRRVARQVLDTLAHRIAALLDVDMA
ncbi:MAG TPA: hypothetical protein VGK73_10510 [Polyangiaceae bacterium]